MSSSGPQRQSFVSFLPTTVALLATLALAHVTPRIAHASEAMRVASGSVVTPDSPAVCLTPAHTCVTIPVDIARSDAVGMRLFHVDFSLSPNLTLCGTTATSVLEGTYLSGANPNTTFFVVDNGGGSYTADGTINGTPCGATAATGTLFDIQIAANGTGTGTVTVDAVTLRDCVNTNLPVTPGPAAQVPIDTAPVAIASITTPQPVVETHLLTITPALTLSSCASGPVTWTASTALPAGASLDAGTGVITWTPACGTVGTYGPFSLTATDAIGDAATSNAFTIDVTYNVGTVTVAAIATPQTVAELSPLTITPSASLTDCATGPLAWTVSPALPGGAALDPLTGVITWTPDCAAAEGGTAGTYGPFTLTATAATLESGSSNAFSIHVTNTPVAIGPPTAVSATQVLTGNAPGDTTAIVIHFTAPPGGVLYKVYRAPFGGYPWYDDAGGAAPAQPTTYPPPGPWQLTGVTADGGADTPPSRDFWYYVVYAQNACGDVSLASTMTAGTLDYDLGDVTNGFVHGLGDNHVQSEDISELGAHYGIVLGSLDPLGYLDVGPTTTSYVDGRPLTDKKINFEDLVMFAINYGHTSSPALAARPATSAATGRTGGATTASADQLVLSSPDHVAMGEPVTVPIEMDGTGAVQAMSIRLSWDPAVVRPVGQSAGALLLGLDGVVLSASPGTIDATVLGKGRGVAGEGELATITFEVISAGDPRIRIESVDGRDTRNRSFVVGASRLTTAPEPPKVTGLERAMPNPFHGSVTLAISLAQRGPLELEIFSVDGRRVRTMASGVHGAGSYQFVWDGRDESGNDMQAGVYYARMNAGAARFTRTLTLLK